MVLWLSLMFILAALLSGVSSPQPAVSWLKAEITIPQIEAQQRPGDLRNPEDLAPFFDAFFAKYLPELHVPGAALTLVKDGKTLFSKGYGYADLEHRIPVDPETTVFGVASVSKAITATAVMQLVEAGKLDLQADINQYLDGFQIERTFEVPITVAQLLTHTDGFDDRFIGAAARSMNEVMPLQDYVATQMPARIRPPGEVISYGNFGLVLAGYLVQQVSGMPFTQYIEEKILQPLGMTQSSFRQDAPVDSPLNRAIGYQYRELSHPKPSVQVRGVRNPPLADAAGLYQALPFYYANDVPSGVFQGTAADITRFMTAHLQGGRWGDRQILRPETAALMHQQQFTNDLHLPGWCYGFNERFQNGIRVIEKAGSKPGFNSLMLLVPDHNLGFFLTYNRSSKKLREALVNAFFDAYFPDKSKSFHFVQSTQQHTQPASQSVTQLSNQPTPQPKHKLHDFVGRYRYVRYPHRTLEKIGPVLLGFPQAATELQVTLNENDNLALETVELTYQEPLLFQTQDGTTIAFRENNQHQITHVLIGSDAFEKLRWYETKTMQIRVFGGCVLVLLLIVLSEIYQSFSSQLPYSTGALSRTFRQLEGMSILTIGLNLVFLIGFVSVLVLGNLYEFAYRVPPLLVALLVIPVITAGLTVVLIGLTVMLGWQNLFVMKSGTIFRQLRYVGILMTSVIFLHCLNYWNLLGFNF
jgi:CubicO group peptidase (beta-lactamase class C family)